MEINIGLLGRRTRDMSEHEGMQWVIVFEVGWVYWMKIFIIFMDDEAVWFKFFFLFKFSMWLTYSPSSFWYFFWVKVVASFSHPLPIFLRNPRAFHSQYFSNYLYQSKLWAFRKFLYIQYENDLLELFSNIYGIIFIVWTEFCCLFMFLLLITFWIFRKLLSLNSS